MKIVWLLIVICSLLHGAAQESPNCPENTEELYFTEQAVTDLRFLATCKHLKQLYLSFNAIEDIRPLAELSELEELWISYNPIKTLEPLAKLRKLKTLALDTQQIDHLKPEQWIAKDIIYVDIDERMLK